MKSFIIHPESGLVKWNGYDHSKWHDVYQWAKARPDDYEAYIIGYIAYKTEESLSMFVLRWS
jgi:hypothetical protein